MSDFEIALRNAIKNCFPDSVIVGCFFHYVKAIVNKFKQLGLLKKKYFLNIYKILFYFKIYPFLYEEDQRNLLDFIIETFINSENIKSNKNIIKFLIYFLKNWYGTSFTHFLDLTGNKLNIRTNNIAE